MCSDDQALILLCGIPSEPPLAMVKEALDALGVAHVLFGQRSVRDVDLELEIRGGRPTGLLTIGDQAYPLESFDGTYLRLMEDTLLPELSEAAADGPERSHSRMVHQLLISWADVTAGRVLNRPGAMASNGSKPYQAQLIADQGFRIPETLITSDPERVREFAARHPDVVYKSISGMRSIVQRLEPSDYRRLTDIEWCPVQFQEMVPGRDVRVHTVGSELFATAIDCGAVDYRYARDQIGDGPRLSAFNLPVELAERCVQLSSALGLSFAGIDLRIAPSGEAYCFEVNPCPVYSYYESNTGQPIAATVARYLAGRA